MTIRNLVAKHKVSFMGLVETNHRRAIKSRIKRMWGHDAYGMCEVYASEAHSGGVVAIWDSTILRVTNKLWSERWILLEGCIINSNFECCIGVVYGPNDRIERNNVFSELRSAITSINKPSLLLGDFNVILHSRERVGTFTCNRSVEEFSEWIRDLGLIDIPLQGLKFTWRRNESKSKLDRGLCSNDWLIKFPNLKLMGLKRSCSDHNPLILNLEDNNNWGPKPFRTYNAWFMNPNFKRFIRNEWANLPTVPLNEKMKILKGPMRRWSREHFDQLDNKISSLETAIHELEKLSDARTLCDMEKARLSAAQTLLQSCLIRRERIWRQKARSYGLKMKDHNTKFFIASTLLKRKKNEIVKTKVNGRCIQGISNLKSEIRNFFAQRFSQDSMPALEFDLGNHPKITIEQANSLESYPSREEVKNAVWACGVDKAPGHDGYNFKFIREMWEVIKELQIGAGLLSISYIDEKHQHCMGDSDSKVCRSLIHR